MPHGPQETYIIIGSGQAACRAAEGMRQAGFAGRLCLIGDEAHLPYERPPLSKGILRGNLDPDAACLRAAGWYADHDIDLRLSTRVDVIDRSNRTVSTDTGARLSYDRVLLATGASPVRPAFSKVNLEGVHVLRSLDDSLAIRAGLKPGSRVVLVGGGYIGLEVADAARALGCDVTVVEAADGLMRRQVAPAVGDWYQRRHEAHGVRVLTGATVTRLIGGDRVSGIALDDGREIAADIVVVGVGVRPNTALAEACGLEVDDGVKVDERGCTADPDIFAAGDVTNHPNPLLGHRLRLESWQNAQNQALVAGRAMAGAADARHAEVPWFWSDQLGTTLQIVGVPDRDCRLVWRTEARDAAAFTVFYIARDGRVVGANAVDRPGDIAVARCMIERGLAPDLAQLADPAVSLKKVLKALT